MAGQFTFTSDTTIRADVLNANFAAIEREYLRLQPTAVQSDAALPTQLLLNPLQLMPVVSGARPATGFDAVGDEIIIGAMPPGTPGQFTGGEAQVTYTLYAVNTAADGNITGGPASSTDAGEFKIKYGNPQQGYIDLVQNIPLPRSASDYQTDRYPSVPVQALWDRGQFFVAEVTEAAGTVYSAGNFKLVLHLTRTLSFFET